MKKRTLALREPNECLTGLWRCVPGYIRLTFSSAFVLGLLVHLYMFANKFTNHDDLNQMFYADYGTASGRWLLPPVLRLDGNISVPWLIGVLSVLCLAGVACVTVSLLRIRRPAGCILTAALVVSFPTVTATFGYMFSADAYFLSLLMAVSGAYAAVKWGWRGSVLAVVLITLSLSIYQGYLPVAAVLMVGALLLETLDGERSFRELFLKGLRLLATLLAALAAYMLSVRLTTFRTGLPLTDYEGISDMGKISLADLPRLIAASYRKHVDFFLKNDWNCQFDFLKYAFLLTGLGCLAIGAMLLLRRRLGPARTALAAALAAVYPLAGALIYVMVPNGYIHIHMLYGLVYILIAPIALMEYALPEFQRDRTLHAAVSWVVLLTMTLTSYSYAVTANNAYMKADLGMRQCAAYSNRLLERIESCEGYRQGMDVVLVGSNIREDALRPTPEADTAWLVGIFDMGNLRTYFTYRNFLRFYLGFTDPVFTGDSETARNFAATEQVQGMPLYPEAGSVQVIEGSVVVKLNE